MTLSDTAPLGEILVGLCAGAKKSLLLAAPFVKRTTLERLLDAVPPTVPVRCVTRWIPEEIIAGVADLEVWPLLQERGNATLALRSDLHAKYYRADDACLIGSANLTYAALGWRPKANLELLLPMSASDETLVAFEQKLMLSVEVDDELYREYRRVVEELRSLVPQPIVTGEILPHEIAGGETVPLGSAPDPNVWLPVLRHPAQLFDAYGGDLERLTSASRTDALRDLQAFTLPAGLSQDAFRGHVRLQLLQMPIVRRVDAFVEKSQRFGAVRDFLMTQPCAKRGDFDASEAWQTLMRWLLFFAEDRYTAWRANYSEIFAKRPA